MFIVRFLKNWTLPVAMSTGVLWYFVFTKIPFLFPLKPMIKDLVDVFPPILIFSMLLLTFCKVDPRDISFKKWHLILLLFQAAACFLLTGCALIFENGKIILEGTIVCFICPTATAAAVVAQKLKGNASSLVAYTLLANILAAVVVPVAFPLLEQKEGVTFMMGFSKILYKVFVLLICPFIAAWILRAFVPKAHSFLLKYHDLAFYLWAVSLTIVSAETARSVYNSDAGVIFKISIAVAALVACVIQFSFGQAIGRRYNDKISAGLSLGQKNTVLAIWMTYVYLAPVASIAPGSYILWQNTFNSWRLYKQRKADEAGI